MNKIEIKRHSYSHILAAAVLKMFPEAKLAIGPAIDNGFYYDFDLPRTLIPEDLPLLEKEMKNILKQSHPFERADAPIENALREAKEKGQIYKAELIADLAENGEKTVSFYRTDGFVDLCAGPHVENTKELDPKAFKLTSIAGAYWKGSEKNKMLQRIYGLAFDTAEELAKYEELQEEAKKRDHRKLGQELDLFSFNEVGPGFPFWHPKGMIVRNLLTDYWKEEHRKAGYQEINTPIILREELWHQSGHWDNYKDNMYFTEIDEQGYAIKPMNCPGGIQVYKSNLHSYREFPIRYAELGLVHRHELSGVLHGLFRVRSFTQDDAHIYCMESQVKQEIEGVIKLIEKMYKDLGFTDYHVELSTRPEKSIGSDEVWQHAESVMEEVAKDLKLKYVLNPGDGAFYGPKFDFHITDAIGRTWQCATIQLDFSMPERFNLEYVAEDGSRKRPIMIHRTVFGSLERFLGIVLENYAGALPYWLAPVQIRLLPIADRHIEYCQKLAKELDKNGVRYEIDDSKESFGKKIRNAEMAKIPYMLVVGDKEIEANKPAIRSYQEGDLGQLSLGEILKKAAK
jgi:threonyl-tRNA synthetase